MGRRGLIDRASASYLHSAMGPGFKTWWSYSFEKGKLCIWAHSETSTWHKMVNSATPTQCHHCMQRKLPYNWWLKYRPKMVVKKMSSLEGPTLNKFLLNPKKYVWYFSKFNNSVYTGHFLLSNVNPIIILVIILYMFSFYIQIFLSVLCIFFLFLLFVCLCVWSFSFLWMCHIQYIIIEVDGFCEWLYIKHPCYEAWYPLLRPK